jgi:hypothetical protein
MQTPFYELSSEDLIEALSNRIGKLVVECEALRRVTEDQALKIANLESSLSLIADNFPTEDD